MIEPGDMAEAFLSFDLSLTDARHPLHVEHMSMALEEAGVAASEDEVPVGCVIVSLKHGVIARAHNQRQRLLDPTAHAEMIAITQAAQRCAPGGWKIAVFTLLSNRAPCAPERSSRRGCRLRCTAAPIRRPGRAIRSTASRPIAGSTIARLSSAACWRISAARSWPTSSRQSVGWGRGDVAAPAANS